jgi:hypothetical protein
VSFGLSTMRYKLVSSANSLISALISFTISFIKIINKRSPSVINSHKHLGVIISDNGQWNDHIDYIVKKTYNRLNIMRKSRTL